MPGILSRINKARDARQKKKDALNDLQSTLPAKPKWDDAYTRPTVEPDEIEDLLKCCSEEIKARGLDHPFLLLPFRPTSNPSAVRTFIRNFFDNNPNLRGEALVQELRMFEPMVLAGIVKWCWSRLSGGVVSWDVYELFKVGELDSNTARDAFKTFIPLSVENDSRQNIIFSFFDLLAAIAAHGMSNGFGGRKLSRMAAWWAFEQKDTGNGFDGGYKAWAKSADATTHLFFAYLRSLSPEQGLGAISMIPRSLEKLLGEVEYPPQPSNLLVTKTNKLVMIVDSVSPTPFALLRRTSHFQYRDSDATLQQFSQFEDPVSALTEECVRVLNAISAANQSQVSSVKHSTNLRDASWSRFEDIGFSSALNEDDDNDNNFLKPKPPVGLRSTPGTGANEGGRPTTPSWADFLSEGFNDDNETKSNVLLPPDKVLPPIHTDARQHSSQSHQPRLQTEQHLEPGELANITAFSLDDAFWWVWMSSLAPEEPAVRKSAFGRCAVVETKIGNGQWLVLEEVVTGAAPEPEDGAYMAEKKSFFSWTKRSKTISRRKSISGRHGAKKHDTLATSDSKNNWGSETQAKIHAKAVQLRSIQEQESNTEASGQRRGRHGADADEKTKSAFNLQPQIVGEASSALKWLKSYDTGTVKDTTPAAQNGIPASLSLPVVSISNEPAEANAVLSAQETKQVDQNQANTAAAASQGGSNDETAPVEEAANEESNPLPPPKDEPAAVTRSSSGMQHRFNQAKEARENRGLRKLFSRRNRPSKLPESESGDVTKVVEDDEPVAEDADAADATDAAETTEQKSAATVADGSASGNKAMATPTTDATKTTEPTEAGEVAEPTLAIEDLGQDKMSGTGNANGAGVVGSNSKGNAINDGEPKGASSRFDQGPLVEQPEFVPESDENDGESTSPVDAKDSSSKRGSTSEKDGRSKDELSQSAGPGVQDRWAQIRKNAANRTAQRQGDQRPRGAKPSDGDDETSGEETIESRVARIKARVAELTGNMEGTSSPSPTASRS